VENKGWLKSLSSAHNIDPARLAGHDTALPGHLRTQSYELRLHLRSDRRLNEDRQSPWPPCPVTDHLATHAAELMTARRSEVVHSIRFELGERLSAATRWGGGKLKRRNEMRSWRGPCGGHTSQTTGSMGRDSSGRATCGYATAKPHRVGCRALVRPLVFVVIGLELHMSTSLAPAARQRSIRNWSASGEI
jgi:hypothetical protein